MSPGRGVPLALALLLAALTAACAERARDGAGRAPAAPTFARDVAPILHGNCAVCHRPGGAGPFSLLSYDDARRRATQIVEVTGSRFMPPWLPEPGEPGFVGERRLSEAQIETLRRWVDSGAPRGEPAEEPPPPEWPSGWSLGEPDLVLRMTESYVVPADGTDVFRNFVIPLPVDTTRWVRALELLPGNPRVVHHAVMGIDPTRLSRRLDAQDPGPGFGGMELGGADQPDGHFLGWTPGKAPDDGSGATAWRIGPSMDMVLQLHMVPSGRPETIDARIGLYCADGPPRRLPSVVMLSSTTIDIPPGAADYRVEDALRLPADVDVLGLYPHAHYLGKDLRAVATLPNGAERVLLHIRDWDFNWQDDYRFAEPVALPAGTLLEMRYSYDNSADNERNPNHPPRRVRYGPRSSDEMGSLLFQLLTRNESDRVALMEAKARHNLDKYPDNPRRWNDLGGALHAAGRPAEALPLYRRSLELAPDDADTHFHLGHALADLGRADEALAGYRRALALDPAHARAHNNAGHLLLSRGRADEALEHLRSAVRIQPDLAMAHYNLGVILAEREDYDGALLHYGRAVEIEPERALAHSNMGTVHQLRGALDQAVACYRRALKADPRLPEAHNNLGLALSALGRREQALSHFQDAVRLRPGFALAHSNLGRALLAAGRRDEALAHFREAVRLDPGRVEARNDLERALGAQAGRPGR